VSTQVYRMSSQASITIEYCDVLGYLIDQVELDKRYLTPREWGQISSSSIANLLGETMRCTEVLLVRQ
jgi:hypothetical protein